MAKRHAFAAAVFAALAAAYPARADPMSDLRDYLSLSKAERRAALSGKPREEQLALLKGVPPIALIHAGQAEAKALGTYKAKLNKRERVGGKLYSQTIDVWIREEPFAARLSFVSGDGKGRKALYNRELREKEIRVKEGGVLGIAGALWLNVDNSLTRKETNHPVTHLGLGPLLSIIEQNHVAAEKHGGMAKENELIDEKGRYAVTWVAPAAAKDLYAKKTRITVDPLSALPLIVEISDEAGLRERYEWVDVEAAPADANTFKPESFGL